MPVVWTGTLPWTVPVAVGAAGLAAESAAWRAIWAALLLVAAAGAAAWQIAARHRRDRMLAALAGHLRRGTAPPRPLVLPDQEERALTAAVRLVAGRGRRTEAALVSLTEDRDRLFAALEGMSEGVLAVGRNERLLLANRAAVALLGLPPGDLTGRPVWEVVRRSAVTEACERVLSGAGRFEAEFEAQRMTLALRADPLPGVHPPRGAAGAVLQIRDVTELRRLEAVRREFVSNVSHELKTPIAAISALAETLLGGALDRPAVARAFVADVEEQADRLHGLVVDIIRLARVESGRDVFDVRRVAVGPVVADRLRDHRAPAAQAGVTLRAVPPPEPAFVPADPDALGTVLDNLLDNALRHTPPGGRVTVEWFATPPELSGPVRTESRGAGGEEAATPGTVTLRVADTGEGIPAEHLGRVFERFHRVDPARGRERGGTGLGLAIVRQLAGVFGGTVQVESEPGRGATFTVTLPAA